jgi:hypothetical protein
VPCKIDRHRSWQRIRQLFSPNSGITEHNPPRRQCRFRAPQPKSIHRHVWSLGHSNEPHGHSSKPHPIGKWASGWKWSWSHHLPWNAGDYAKSVSMDAKMQQSSRGLWNPKQHVFGSNSSWQTRWWFRGPQSEESHLRISCAEADAMD